MSILVLLVALFSYTPYTATAYCLKGKTATGTQARSGIVAVDPRVIKLGSRIHIQGLGTFRAEDTGGAIKGRKIDIHMPCGRAKQFGRRTVYVKRL